RSSLMFILSLTPPLSRRTCQHEKGRRNFFCDPKPLAKRAKNGDFLSARKIRLTWPRMSHAGDLPGIAGFDAYQTRKRARMHKHRLFTRFTLLIGIVLSGLNCAMPK